MAMNFFRKWQKAIIITMVVLMVVFLVGVQGIQMLLTKKPGQKTYATTNVGDLTYNEIRTADSNMRLLSTYFNLPQRSMEFIDLQARCGDKVAVAYAMLMKQADKTFPGNLSDGEIKVYLQKIGVNDADYNSIVSQAHLNNRNFSERALKATLAEWIKVVRLYDAAKVSTPASEVKLRKIYRDINEKIKLQVVTLDLEKFKDKTPQPTEEQIVKHFTQYRAMPAGRIVSHQSYGFGYLQPNQVDISWLKINRDVVNRVTQPDPRDVRRYWQQNKSEFKKEVPVVAENSAPINNEAATQPTTQPQKTVTVQMGLEEAWPQIIEKLKADAVAIRMAELLETIQQLTQQYATYQEVVESLTLKADKELNVVIPAEVIASLKGKTLKDAIDALAATAKLNAICYPWEVPGEYSVKSDIVIPETLDASKPMPLGVLLDAITELVFVAGVADAAVPVEAPKITWAMCKGLDAVLIPAGPSDEMNLLLYKAGSTGLSSRMQIGQSKELGLAATSPSGGKSLVEIAFAAEPFTNAETSQIKVGQEGKVMYLGWRGAMGRLVWKLDNAVKAHALETPNAEVRKQVIDDLKLQAAFTLAADEGRKLAAAAKTDKADALASAAKAAGVEAKETDFFSRKVIVSPRQMAIMQIQQMMQYRPNMDYQSMFIRAAMMEPFALIPSRIDTIPMPNQRVGQWFVDRAFDVAPADPDKPETGDLVDVIPVPATRAVYVIKRIGYEPAVAGEFDNKVRRELSDVISAIRENQSRNEFFNWQSIAKRLEFEISQADEE